LSPFGLTGGNCDKREWSGLKSISSTVSLDKYNC
jgi:hypothetical protein